MTRWLARLLAMLSSVTFACSDAPTRRLGGVCGANADCGQDICYSRTCLDPAADDDLDGLQNALEIALGTSPVQADSDGDGTPDPNELDATLVNIDSDGDGVADALESAILDADGDCLPDQVDPQNLVPDTHDIDADGISDVCDTPEPPVVTGIDPLSPSSDPNPVVRGSGDPNTPVAIFFGTSCEGTALATGACAADGSFAIAVPALDNAETRFALSSSNPADLVSACLASPVAYVHDDIAPQVPAFESIDPPSPSSDVSPRVTGTAEAQSRLELHADPACAETPLGTGEAADGTFSILVAVPANADTTVYAVALDLAGNRSACVVLTTYRHDDQPPAPPTAHPAPFTPESPSTTTTPVLRGCAEEGATLDLYRAADCLGEPIATSTADLPDLECATGAAFSSIVPASPNASTTFYGTARDLAGNTSTCATLATWVHDDLPPGPPVMLASQVAAVPNPSNDPAPVVRFCADTTSEVAIYLDPACTLPGVAATPVAGSTICDGLPGSGERSFTLAVDSLVTYYAQAIDLAGNRSDCAALLVYQFDDVAPSLPLQPGNFIDAGAAFTTSTTVSLALSATDSVGVTGYYASETPTTPFASATDWTAITPTTSYAAEVSFTLSGGDGTKTVYVWFKDAAGNVSAPASDSILLSATPSSKLVGTWGETTLARDNAGTWSTEACTFTYNGDYTGAAKCEWNYGGTFEIGAPDTFTYTAEDNPDGSLTTAKTFASDGATRTHRWVIGDDGKVMILDGTTRSGIHRFRVVVRLDAAKTYTNADLNGDYYLENYLHNSTYAVYRARSGIETFDGVRNRSTFRMDNQNGTMGTSTGAGTYSVDPAGSFTADAGGGTGSAIGYLTGDGSLAVDVSITFTDAWGIAPAMKKADKSYTTADLAGTWAISGFWDDMGGPTGGTPFGAAFGTMTCTTDGSCTVSWNNARYGVVTYESFTRTFDVARDGSFGGSLATGSPAYAAAIGNHGNTMLVNTSFDTTHPSRRAIHIAVRCSTCSDLTGR